MPIYEYTCQQCGQAFEKFVRSVSNLGEVHCPHCGSQQTARSLSVFSTANGGTSKGLSSAAASTGGSCRPSG
ncbi:MAG: zinc ribbon domain-containing protein [Chloroflexi bacterium]|nr:zinc ribbon domain-containing protein [Chloroflexota bacterium]MBU1748692.1 zinc ribbon domain-containing protein [Chloroflexota bacterium]MBU1880371.1 zinc ribbon domain-containing protein [Chloroflexota bacterium]